ncbi:GIN domain-containing protein [Halobacteriota archaeon]
MKKVMVAVLLGVILVSTFFIGCLSAIEGSGNLETKQYDLSDFARVDVSHNFEVEIDQSGSYSVSITSDDNLFEYIQVTRNGETLKIGLKPSIVGPYLGSTTLKAKITMPELRGLDISGATRGTVTNFRSTEDLDIQVSGASSLDLVEMSASDIDFEISGASRVTGDIIANDAVFEVSGGSTVQLEGSVSDIVVDASGASRVELAAFPVNNADVTLSGGSSGIVSLEGRLDADLSGSSKLEYIGERVTLGTIKTSGGAIVSKK